MKLKHPVSKQIIDPEADRAEMYESQGWEQVKAAKTTAPKPRKPAKKAAKRATASKAAK